jgi:hypothetical protein
MSSSVSRRSWLGPVALALVFAACAGEGPPVMAAEHVGDLRLGKLPRAPYDEALVRACGAGDTTALGDQALLRMPYLQRVTATSADVLWTTDAPDACSVRLRGPDGQVRSFPAHPEPGVELPRGRQYLTSLDGLRPGATYCYSIVCDGGPWLDETGFRTAPADDAPVNFVAMGDLGEASEAQIRLAEQAADTSFDFALLTGDLAYPRGRLRDFEANFFDVYASLLRHVPFFVASGNHDRNTSPKSAFSQVFALPDNGGPEGRQRWYSFDWGPVHVAVLDTERVGKVQAEWLDRDLAASRAPWKIVAGHKGPYSSGAHGSDLDVRRWFVPLFEKHGVALALWGHDHDYERSKPMNGVTYIVTGGGGESSRAVGRSRFTAFSDPAAHFVHVTADRDALRVFAVDARGREFDSVRIPRSQR